MLEELEKMVALHPEGVNRNNEALTYLGISNTVALHPEGVDRNARTVM